MINYIQQIASWYSEHKSTLHEYTFKLLALLSLGIALTTLALLIIDVMMDGLTRLDFTFIKSFPSRHAEEAGIYPALIGSVYLVLLTAVVAIPIGVGAAIYLEEYAKDTWLNRLIEVNIANLAGVPSIVYGILGLGLFVRMLALGRSLLAGALTMALLILPIIIIATREAIRTVPQKIAHASLALGASKWQTIWHHILPYAFPNILTGIILAVSRAIGETAPLIAIGALTYVAFLPDDIFSSFTVLPIQIFNWVSRPQAEFHVNAAAGIIVLLGLTLLLNAFAIYLRNRYSKKL